MKNSKVTLCLLALGFTCMALSSAASSPPAAGLAETGGSEKPQPPFLMLPVGAVKPHGWMLEQLKADLAGGITGNYDAFHANVAGRLFAKQERVPGTKVMGSRGIAEKCWWAGEHEGYWHDGLVRAAILAGSKPDLERIRVWVEDILARSDETGYVGIYSPETRFPAKGFDGELWTQSRAMEALLAWYEFTGDRRVLDAVAGSVRKTIDHYREKGSYFQRPGVDGGITHGVGYMDTLEWLWRLTGDDWFADATAWLYEDYNGYKNADLQVDNMLDPEKLWKEHTPHTAESLHLPGIAGFFSGDERFKKASSHVMPKLARHTNPGGGFIAGRLESIGEVIGGGDEANEYCSKTEAIITLGRLFQYEPDPALGDWSERCALNAAQGARFHDHHAGAIYLSRDNRLRADNADLQGGREIFSAAHRPAACCTLNVTRLLPSYIAGMWYSSTGQPGLFANLYGPSRLETEIGGTPVVIEQETTFPFSGQITFRIDPASPVAFDLVLRVPPNSGKIALNAPGAAIERSGRTIRLAKTWKPGDVVTVDFDFQVARRLQQDDRQAFYEWGPLVFALPLDPVVAPLKEIERNGEKTGFFDFVVNSSDPSRWATLDDPDATFVQTDLPDGDPLHPWSKPTVALDGALKTLKGEPLTARLLPLGSTLLRRTTFPLDREAAQEADKKHKGATMRDEDDPMRDF